MRIETRKNVASSAVKFGGSSPSSPQKISRAVDMVRRETEGGTQTAVAVSSARAFGGRVATSKGIVAKEVTAIWMA